MKGGPRWANWTPVCGLGVTMIISYGSMFYAHAILLPLIAREFGWSLAQVFGVLSLALLLGGMVAPAAGMVIDRRGGWFAMMLGSIMSAVFLAIMGMAPSVWGVMVALIAVEMAATLVFYEAGFSALTQIFARGGARRAITRLTLFGGFASTVFWPVTLWLSEAYGWRGSVMVFAALHLLVCLPLHAAVLRGARPLHGPAPAPEGRAYVPLAGRPARRAMVWMVLAFTLGGFLVAGMTAHWVTALTGLGLSAAGAVAAGTLIGPAQVGVRLAEMAVGDRFHPRTTALASLWLMAAAMSVMLGLGVSVGATPAGAAVFAILFGMSNGLTSIVRGTLPLALFGLAGYAVRQGWVSFVRMGANAAAPLGIAVVVAGWGAAVAFAGLLALALAALLAMTRIPRGQRRADEIDPG